jgi:hypothetical protein
MYRFIVVFLFLIVSKFAHSYAVIITEYGEILEIKNGIEKKISIKALGGVYHVSKDIFESKDMKSWVDISKEDKIKKTNLTPLAYFEKEDSKKYLNGCYIYYQADSETHIRLSDSGHIIIKRISISSGEIIEKTSSGQLKKYKNVFALIDDDNEIVFTSEGDEKNNKLLVFSDPKFNEWELQYVINDCATGDRIN